MSMRNRLSKLERTDQLDAVDCDALLVELLAKRDALHWPRREFFGDGGKHNYGSHIERRCDDLRGKLGFSAKASGAADWKEASERRAIVITRGQAKAVRTRGGEIGGLHLTDQGIADARALVGSDWLKDFSDIRVQAVWELLNRWFDAKVLINWSVRGCWFSKHSCYVSESRLFGLQLTGDPTSWNHLTELLLPLLTSGRVHSCCDLQGRIYYSPTITAQEAIKHSRELPEPPTTRYSIRDGMDQLYIDTFNAELLALYKLEETHEMGTIPVPATGLHMLAGETQEDFDQMPCLEGV